MQYSPVNSIYDNALCVIKSIRQRIFLWYACRSISSFGSNQSIRADATCYHAFHRLSPKTSSNPSFWIYNLKVYFYHFWTSRSGSSFKGIYRRQHQKGWYVFYLSPYLGIYFERHPEKDKYHHMCTYKIENINNDQMPENAFYKADYHTNANKM